MEREQIARILQKCGQEFADSARMIEVVLTDSGASVVQSERLIPSAELLDIYRSRHMLALSKGEHRPELERLVNLFSMSAGARWRLVSVAGRDITGGLFLEDGGTLVGCIADRTERP